MMDGLATAVHALQRERGLSTGFVAGKGQVFAQELKDQRRTTDEAVGLLRERLKTVLAAGVGAEQDQTQAATVDDWLGLADKAISLRPRVALAVPGAEVVRSYSEAIAPLLKPRRFLQALPPTLSTLSAGLTQISVAKEAAGVERATGNGMLSAGQTNPEGLARLRALEQQQSVALAASAPLLPASFLTAVQSFELSALNREVATLRQRIAAPAAEGLPRADRWFGLTTQRIDALRAIEQDGTSHLLAEAERTSDAARRRIMIDGGLLLTVLVLAGGFALATARSVGQTLGSLRDTMTRLAQGDLGAPIPYLDRKDEIGAMAHAIDQFKSTSQKMLAIELEERGKTEARIARANANDAMVEEVSSLVEAAAAGDFSMRLQSGGGSEAIAAMVRGLNTVNALIDSATAEFMTVLDATSAGDFTASVTTPYQGRLGELRSSLNTTLTTLSSTLQAVQSTSSNVATAAEEIRPARRTCPSAPSSRPPRWRRPPPRPRSSPPR